MSIDLILKKERVEELLKLNPYYVFGLYKQLL